MAGASPSGTSSPPTAPTLRRSPRRSSSAGGGSSFAPVRAVVIYESLTGNTRKAAELIAGDLRAAGHEAVACPTTAVDYQALHAADLVVVGGWTDGLFFVAQRPGRAGRLRK